MKVNNKIIKYTFFIIFSLFFQSIPSSAMDSWAEDAKQISKSNRTWSHKQDENFASQWETTVDSFRQYGVWHSNALSNFPESWKPIQSDDIWIAPPNDKLFCYDIIHSEKESPDWTYFRWNFSSQCSRCTPPPSNNRLVQNHIVQTDNSEKILKLRKSAQNLEMGALQNKNQADQYQRSGLGAKATHWRSVAAQMELKARHKREKASALERK